MYRSDPSPAVTGTRGDADAVMNEVADIPVEEAVGGDVYRRSAALATPVIRVGSERVDDLPHHSSSGSVIPPTPAVTQPFTLAQDMDRNELLQLLFKAEFDDQCVPLLQCLGPLSITENMALLTHSAALHRPHA